nr:uncharacterized protein YsdA-like [Hydra vulgaris]
MDRDASYFICCGKGMQMLTAVGLTVSTTVFIAIYGCSFKTDMRVVIAIYLLILNILTALVFWFDKYCAKNNRWRVAENVLLWLTFYGSPIGALLGMYCVCCLHKTNKKTFSSLAIILMMLNLFWVAIYFITHKPMSLQCA